MSAPVLISIMMFGALTLLTLGILFSVRYAGERRKVLARIESEKTSSFITSAALSNEEALSCKRYLRSITTILGNFAKPKSEEELARINKRFIQAGYRGKNMAIFFFGAKVLCGALLSIGFLFVQLLLTRHMSAIALGCVGLVLVALGFYLPNVWLNLKISMRREQLTLGFPDALDLLVVCVEAGMGVDAAINRVGQEMKLANKALSEEFSLLNLELRAGKSRRDALKNLAFRTGLDDVNSLVTLLVQTEKFGTNVGQALRVHSDSMRTKRAQRAEELAAKLPVKLLFPTILFIFPSLFLVLMGPALIQAYRIWISR